MTREEAISVLRQELHYLNGGHAPNIYEYEEALDMAIAALKAQGNCCKKGNSWISVADRLPEIGQRVLVYCESRMFTKHTTVSTYMTTYSAKRKTYFSRRVRNVTHWMPLPSTEGLNET